ncbi:PIG-L deacetylase family protein [Chloroflexota bacterium]
MNMPPVDVLVITPHPDDAEFGAAGTVARWIREGKTIVYAAVTSGDKGTSDVNMKPEELARIREEEQRCAAGVLGVREVTFLRYLDQALEDTPEFRRDIVRLIRKYRPYTVISADPYRRYLWHRDHRITGRVVLDAIFPYARDLLAYPELLEEGLLPHKVKEVLLWATEDPNYWVDVTDTFPLKMAALNCHKSQMGKHMPSNIEDWLRERAQNMAQGQGFELAEAFHREEITR